MSKESRIEALKAAAEKKKREAGDSLEKAIKKLTAEGQPLTFANVAREAGLSVSYLYKYPEIKERLEGLRKQQQQVGKPTVPQKASDNSKSVMIYQLRERIKKLEAEIIGLRKVNEGLAGRVYHLQEGYALAERLKIENKELKAKVERLERELEKCRAQVSSQNNHPPSSAKITSIEEKRGEKLGVTDQIKQELTNLGIRLNSTLGKAIKSASEETVANAIEALKEAIVDGNIDKPEAWLKRAIEEGWMPNGTPQHKTDKEIFDEWFPLAKRQGLVSASEGKKDGIWIYTQDGKCIPFKEALAKYPLESL